MRARVGVGCKKERKKKEPFSISLTFFQLLIEASSLFTAFQGACLDPNPPTLCLERIRVETSEAFASEKSVRNQREREREREAQEKGIVPGRKQWCLFLFFDLNSFFFSSSSSRPPPLPFPRPSPSPLPHALLLLPQLLPRLSGSASPPPPTRSRAARAREAAALRSGTRSRTPRATRPREGRRGTSLRTFTTAMPQISSSRGSWACTSSGCRSPGPGFSPTGL